MASQLCWCYKFAHSVQNTTYSTEYLSRCVVFCIYICMYFVFSILNFYVYFVFCSKSVQNKTYTTERWTLFTEQVACLEFQWKRRLLCLLSSWYVLRIRHWLCSFSTNNFLIFPFLVINLFTADKGDVKSQSLYRSSADCRLKLGG